MEHNGIKMDMEQNEQDKTIIEKHGPLWNKMDHYGIKWTIM